MRPSNPVPLTPEHLNTCKAGCFRFKWDTGGFLPHSTNSDIMDGSRLSDFSIERILSPEVGRNKPEPQTLHGGFSLDSGSLRPPLPVPVGLLQYRVFGETSYPCTAGFHHPDCSGVYLHFSNQQEPADGHQLIGHHGYHPVGFPAQSQLRQKARVRTVFTDCQTKQLEALFELTDYPPVEVRAEVARRTGLSEEIVRVWFKNRRARRKQQRSGSKVKSPSPPRGSEADGQVFASFL